MQHCSEKESKSLDIVRIHFTSNNLHFTLRCVPLVTGSARSLPFLSETLSSPSTTGHTHHAAYRHANTSLRTICRPLLGANRLWDWSSLSFLLTPAADLTSPISRRKAFLGKSGVRASLVVAICTGSGRQTTREAAACYYRHSRRRPTPTLHSDR